MSNVRKLSALLVVCGLAVAVAGCSADKPAQPKAQTTDPGLKRMGQGEKGGAATTDAFGANGVK